MAGEADAEGGDVSDTTTAERAESLRRAAKAPHLTPDERDALLHYAQSMEIGAPVVVGVHATGTPAPSTEPCAQCQALKTLRVRAAMLDVIIGRLREALDGAEPLTDAPTVDEELARANAQIARLTGALADRDKMLARLVEDAGRGR